MSPSRRDVMLVLALVIAAVMPTLGGLGNPTNIAAVLMAAMVATARRPSFRLGAAYAIALTLVLATLSTLAGAINVGGPHAFNPNAFGPFFRIAICYVAVTSADDPVFVFRWLLRIGAAASAFAVLQYASPSVAEFTSQYYLSAERSSVFAQEFGDDLLVRVIGFYENPSSVALLAVVFIILSLTAYDRKAIGRGALWLFVAMHLGAGLLSFSKVFFACLPILLLQLVLTGHRKAALVAVAASIAAFWIAATIEHPLIDVLRYAFESSIDSEAALKGRYLAEQAAAIDNSWLFGYGAVSIEEVMINDSAYLTLAYLIGAFGLAVLAVHLAWALWRQRARTPVALYLVLAALGLAAVGTNSAIGFRADILVAASCGALFATSRPRRPS